ncbi:MAG: DUF2442 domain-containing protein [Chloracidobacterium sp.]|nr:DUF2442 domain-containing protein [Chloracidobacterium sp.]
MARNKASKFTFTEAEIRRQLDESRRLGDKEYRNERGASRYSYDARSREIRLDFADGFALLFPASHIKELRSVADADIAGGKLTPLGDAIHWDALDAHYTVSGLLAGRFGTREWMKEIGRKGGKQTSAAKADAARRNGAKGGRPPTLSGLDERASRRS